MSEVQLVHISGHIIDSVPIPDEVAAALSDLLLRERKHTVEWIAITQQPGTPVVWIRVAK